ncbi:hypothetical protein V1277_004959 [Bradyrhizobium sp. AZCC 1588]
MLPLYLYARVRFCFAHLHTRPRVQPAPGLPCALSVSMEGQKKMQTSGDQRREIANGWLLRIELHPSASSRTSEARSGTHTPRRMLSWKNGRWLCVNNEYRWLWVPAPSARLRTEAGTTEERALPSAPQRLQSLEGQPLRVADAGEIELADEGGCGLTVAIGQRHDGVDGNSLGGPWASSCCQGPQATQRATRRLIRR